MLPKSSCASNTLISYNSKLDLTFYHSTIFSTLQQQWFSYSKSHNIHYVRALNLHCPWNSISILGFLRMISLAHVLDVHSCVFSPLHPMAGLITNISELWLQHRIYLLTVWCPLKCDFYKNHSTSVYDSVCFCIQVFKYLLKKSVD